MSNQGIQICPFYLDSKDRTISCEDIFRRFDTAKGKTAWMDLYCDSHGWRGCPYAASLLDVYDRMERGDEMAKEQHLIDELRKAYKGLSVKLGKAEKRLTAKDEEIRKLRRQKRACEERYIELSRKYREEEKKAHDLFSKMIETAHSYEGRFCFLLDRYADGIFDEAEFSAWGEGKEFRLIADVKDADGNVLYWKAIVREEVKEEVKDDEKDLSAETEKQVREPEDHGSGDR